MITEESTFIKENTLTSCSFNIADISTSSLAASNWLTLDIVIGIMVCIETKEITT
jgi:Ca2+/Na+ antiporter